MDELKKDARFSHITKDPRFRPASKNERKLKIDRRFASMFNDPKFKMKYTVDKRGRPLLKEHTTRDDMKKFYQLGHDDDDDSSSTSSEEESDSETKKPKKSADDEELDEFLESEESDNDDEEEEDDDEEEEENKSSSSDEDEEIPDADDGIEWNEFDEKCARSDDVSRRLAVCNMDWDRVRAVDIFLLLNSWKQADGSIKSVTIYPSEYGLQQMELEKNFGPIPGVAKPVTTSDQNANDSRQQNEAEEEPEEPEVKSDDDDNVPNYNQDDDQDTTDPVMRERLRKYQLNRLKYYYAVVECDTAETAAKIYEEYDGLEYETSAVRLDLRFIPDSVTFDSSIPPYDQCTQLPDKALYKPQLFRNTALTQTKVRCTWDETPIERRRLTKKKYTLEELEKIDLDAYLASGTDEEPDEDDDQINDESGDENENKNDDAIFKVPTSIPSASKKSKGDGPIARAPSILSTQDDIDRYRALLLDFNEDPKADKKSKQKTKTKFFDEDASDDEGSREMLGGDDDEADSDSDIDMEITWTSGLNGKTGQKSQKPTKQNDQKKNNNKKTKSDKSESDGLDEDDSTENNQDTLELLTGDDEQDGKRNYNLREMIKSHKQSTKAAAKNAKKSKKFQQDSANETNDNKSADDAFQLNVNDQRFQAVYTQPAFNIDQSDHRFKATAGTQRLIDEKLKKRKLESSNSSSRTDRDEDDIVAKLKRKSVKKE
ncbi:unnamed protein product [Adineta ricciae]|uniref:ESF1-like protein n=1 Tax=Adineta ricciae TaxID=249248 RepID=A0A815XXJ4_ADIRI|nr:unnamed protein product [Adineta ricciae]